jgi:hypothetical protein
MGDIDRHEILNYTHLPQLLCRGWAIIHKLALAVKRFSCSSYRYLPRLEHPKTGYLTFKLIFTNFVPKTGYLFATKMTGFTTQTGQRQ